MINRSSLRELLADTRGAAALEFALVAPLLIAMLFSVLQIGLAFQSYNALRSSSADVARYAMVQYAAGNQLTPAALETYAENNSRGAPYMLGGVEAVVVTAATQRVTGATELTLTLTFDIPTLLEGVGVQGPSISYSRPMFLST